MSKKISLNERFQKIKQLPLELEVEKVIGMIESINNTIGFHSKGISKRKFRFNLLLITVTISLLIITGFIFFSIKKTTITPNNNNKVNLPVVKNDTIDKEKTKTNPLFIEDETNESKEKKKELSPSKSNIKKIKDKVVNSTINNTKKGINKSNDEVKDSTITNTDKNIEKVEEEAYTPIRKSGKKVKEGFRKFTTDSSYYVVETTRKGTSEKPKTINLNNEKLKVIKKELKTLLDRQGITLSRKYVIDIWLNDFENITIAGKVPISKELQKEYVKLLNQYNVSPFPNRKVLLSKSFIIIGDFETKQFRGSAEGNIKKIDEETKKYKSIESDKKVYDSKIDFAIKKDVTKDINSDSLNLINQQKNNPKLVNLNNAKLRVIKKRLRDLLKQQNFKIRRRHVLDIWLYDLDDIRISGVPIKKELQAEYVNILNEYKIEAGPNRKILLSKSFIIIGDFETKRFRGSAEGRIRRIDKEILKDKWKNK